MLINVDLPATIAAPAMARRLVEWFLQDFSPPLGRPDRVRAVWLVGELVSTAIDYASSPGPCLGLALACREGTLTVTLNGEDGVSLVARELGDECPRSPAVEILTQLADRWGSHAHPRDGDQVRLELDLGGTEIAT